MVPATCVPAVSSLLIRHTMSVVVDLGRSYEISDPFHARESNVILSNTSVDNIKILIDSSASVKTVASLSVKRGVDDMFFRSRNSHQISDCIGPIGAS
jgi:hypothetical protein